MTFLTSQIPGNAAAPTAAHPAAPSLLSWDFLLSTLLFVGDPKAQEMRWDEGRDIPAVPQIIPLQIPAHTPGFGGVCRGYLWAAHCGAHVSWLR